MFVNDTKSKGIEKSRLKKFREHMFDRGKMEGDITVSGFDLSSATSFQFFLDIVLGDAEYILRVIL